MGTPEFPDLGKHCSVEDCRQIDFLPFSCNLCHQVFCLEHRSYIEHGCPKAKSQDVTVVLCPLCAQGVRLKPDEDPDVTWERHVNTECDPSNYEKVTKKRKCPVPGCKEVLAFSNTIKCRDCTVDHCLKHRFGPDHKCPGGKKFDVGFQFLSLLNRSKKEGSKVSAATVSPQWTTSFVNAALNVRASAEAGMSKLSSEITQAWISARNGANHSSNSSNSNGNGEPGHVECPQCGARFSTVTNMEQSRTQL